MLACYCRRRHAFRGFLSVSTPHWWLDCYAMTTAMQIPAAYIQQLTPSGSTTPFTHNYSPRTSLSVLPSTLAHASIRVQFPALWRLIVPGAIFTGVLQQTCGKQPFKVKYVAHRTHRKSLPCQFLLNPHYPPKAFFFHSASFHTYLCTDIAKKERVMEFSVLKKKKKTTTEREKCKAY